MLDATPLRVVILDDESQRREQWKGRLERAWTDLAIRDRFTVNCLDTASLAEALRVIHERRSYARDPENSTRPEDSCVFDSADVLFVDYDLFNESSTVDAVHDLTGATVAYLVRCFSNCGIVVSVNQFEYSTTTFDLTLSGHVDTFADFHVSPEDLSNPNLWHWRDRAHGFRPWSWPVLPESVVSFRERVRELSAEDAMNSPIMGYFGFENLPNFSVKALQFLGDRDPDAVTFSTFIRGSHGLRNKDKIWDGCAARIAAARISKWLRDLVVPGQDVLVDAPHLLSRMPSLIWTPNWNDVPLLRSDDANHTFEQAARHAFGKSSWLEKPAWFWHTLKDDDSIAEVADPWGTEPAPYLFLEDVSEFATRAREFVADFDSAYKSRFVSELDVVDVHYKPYLRLALGRGVVSAEAGEP
jgi:hypothetical protein